MYSLTRYGKEFYFIRYMTVFKNIHFTFHQVSNRCARIFQSYISSVVYFIRCLIPEFGSSHKNCYNLCLLLHLSSSSRSHVECCSLHGQLKSFSRTITSKICSTWRVHLLISSPLPHPRNHPPLFCSNRDA